MHLRTAGLALAAASACLYLSSYSSGPASRNNDATSSGLGGSKCATCHNGGNFGTATTLQLLDSGGEAVADYRPGESYTLRIEIATSTAPSAYGLQVLAVDAAAMQAGAFGDAPANTRLSDLNGRTYFEQRRRLGESVQEIEWVAPEEGTGPVTIYAVGNAVNGNGGTSGDEPNEAIVTFAEASSSAVASRLWPAEIRIAAVQPGALQLISSSTDDRRYAISLSTIDGRAVASRRVLAKAPLSYTNLSPGLYVVSIRDEKGAMVSRVVPVLR